MRQVSIADLFSQRQKVMPKYHRSVACIKWRHLYKGSTYFKTFEKVLGYNATQVNFNRIASKNLTSQEITF